MKVLVVRFSSLGDCILLCPLLAALKSAGADEITVVTKRDFIEVFADADGVDRVVAFEPRAGLRGLMQIGKEHRNQDYIVIDAHHNWRSRFLSWWIGGAHARIRKYYRERVGLIVFKRHARIPTILEQYGALAVAAGINPYEMRPGGITPSPSAQRRADIELAGHERGRGRAVAIAPGSRWPMKRWSETSYLQLAKRLVQKHNLDVVLLGDAGDRPVTEPIAEALGERCLDLAGRASFLETAACLRRCVAFVGNDSGLMHLAEAVGVPVVALFGPTVESFGYFPGLEQSKVVERRLSCRPCSRNGARPCPKGTQECLQQIQVAHVEKACTDMINATGPRHYQIA